MKRFLYLISLVTLASLILSACNGPASPVVTNLPVVTEPLIATDPPPVIEQPTQTELPTATLVSIDIAGPPMEVG